MPLEINGLERAFIPYFGDLTTEEAGNGIFTAVLGSPPNRQFVIEWRTSYFQRAGSANFEVLLTEGSGTLSVIYGANTDNGSMQTSGIQSSDLGPFTQFSCGESTLVNGLRVNYVPTGGPPPPPPPPPPPGPLLPVPVGSSVSVGSGVSVGVADGVGEGLGGRLGVTDGEGRMLGEGVGTTGAGDPSGRSRRLAPTPTSVPIDPIATANTSRSANAWARTATGRPGPNADAHESRTSAMSPCRADGRGIGSAAIAAMTRSSNPIVGAATDISAYTSMSRAVSSSPTLSWSRSRSSSDGWNRPRGSVIGRSLPCARAAGQDPDAGAS
jgi:hypothetical protein